MTKEERDLLVSMADVLTDVLHFWRQSHARRAAARETLADADVEDLRYERNLIKLCSDKLAGAAREVEYKAKLDVPAERKRVRERISEAFAKKPKGEDVK